MSYLGRGLDKISNVEILDNLVFDNSSSYSITKGSVAFTPNSAQSCLISIDGVVQATNFSVNSSTIDFGVAIPSTSVCNFFLHYGTGVMTLPSDGSVTESKIGSNAVTEAKLGSNAVTSAKINYPLTTFSSTGIDDNATANALTIDSSSNLQFNSGFGSVATAYGVRVWLRYDQVNNVVEASGNVSSVTDSATGDYTINFTNNMPDGDYALGSWSGRNGNPIVAGESNNHAVGSIVINTGNINSSGNFTKADVDDTTVIIVK